MYDKSYGVNWKDVIIKVVLLVLFILLLLWIIPNPNLNTFYDAVFNNNLQTMKTAAKAYYTVDELPENIGESTSMSLAEMLSQKMVIPFIDKDGNYCDTENSYAKVTKKQSDKYLLKVHLKCDGQEDYIEETIGCYDVCDRDGGCSCLTEYQFKQTTTSPTTVYSCPTGWTKDGKTCYRYVGGDTKNASQITIDNSKTVDAQKTSGGYKYVNASKKADVTTYVNASKNADGYKYVDAERKVEATDGYYECTGSGWTLSGSTCYKYVDDSETKSATWVSGETKYTCSSGYSIYNTSQCKSNTGSSQTSSGGYYVNGTCYTTYYKNLVSNASTNSYTLTYLNKRAYKPNCGTASQCASDGLYYWYNYCPRSWVAGASSCPSGTTLFTDGKCYTITNATKTTSGGYYTCSGSGWSLSGSTCYKDSTSKETKSATWRSGSTKVNYYCSQGTIYNTSQCKIAVSGSYYCNQGTLVNTNQCKIVTPGAYYCNEGTLVNTNQCKIKTNDSYYCTEGILNGTKCTIKSTTTDYTCPSGYTQSSDKKICNKNGTKETKNATATQKSQSKTSYKWSTETSLTGWTRTGQERSSCSVNE